MSFRALAGPLVPRGAWEARTAGVFRGAIALDHPDGLWVTILRSREDMEARGIWPGPEAFDALAGLVVPGRTVVFSGKDDPTLATEGGRVRMGALETWDPRPELASASAAFRSAGPTAPNAAAGRLRAALEADGYSEGIHGDGPFARRLSELRGQPDFPFNLAGFGPGTTPAGDDFLAGWILGRILRGDGAEALRRASEIDGSGTTIPGRTLLAGATRGLFPAYLVRLAAALAAAVTRDTGSARAAAYGPRPDEEGEAGDPDTRRNFETELAAAIRAAFSHGASSGRDSMLGMMEGAAHETSQSPQG